MKEDEPYPVVETDARQLALENWMDAVTNLLLHLKYSDIEAWHKLHEALEEYKRVNKP